MDASIAEKVEKGIERLKEEERNRQLAWEREKALYDEISAMCNAWSEGFAEGFAETYAKGYTEGYEERYAEGYEEGWARAKEYCRVALKLRRIGLTKDEIKQVLGI